MAMGKRRVNDQRCYFIFDLSLVVSPASMNMPQPR